MCCGGCDCAKCTGEPVKPAPASFWVRHIGGSGKVYRVHDDFTCWKEHGSGNVLKLPKEEYIVCEAPEQWIVVPVQIVERTHAKDSRDPGSIYDGNTKLASLLCQGKYRIKSLVVEKKVVL